MVKNAMDDRNLQVFRTSGAVVYTVTANPADADGQPFNPFSIREVRYALNYLVDRDGIVREVLGGSGTPLLSAIYPLHPDYPLVHRQLDELDISYDPILADRMISAALESGGATKVAGKWLHGGSPIQITVSASDGPVLAAIAGLLIEELEDMGFVVERRDLDLAGAFAVVYGSDPADFEWHLHVESYGGFTVQKESRGTLAFFYGPWAGHVPGWANPDYRGYENRLLDDLTYAIYAEDFDSAEERARLIRDVVDEGVNEAVRSFIAVEHINFAVKRERIRGGERARYGDRLQVHPHQRADPVGEPERGGPAHHPIRVEPGGRFPGHRRVCHMEHTQGSRTLVQPVYRRPDAGAGKLEGGDRRRAGHTG